MDAGVHLAAPVFIDFTSYGYNLYPYIQSQIRLLIELSGLLKTSIDSHSSSYSAFNQIGIYKKMLPLIGSLFSNDKQHFLFI